MAVEKNSLPTQGVGDRHQPTNGNAPSAAPSASSSTSAEELNEQARKAYAEQRYQEAAELFAKAASLTPTEPAHHYNRGLALLGLKLFAEAEAAFKAAIAVDPDYQAAYSWLGQALFEQKRYGEARSAFESARKFNDHDATIHNWLGRVALTQQQYEEAERDFAEALKLAPAESAYRYNRGLALVGLKRAADAEAEFRHLLSSDPGYQPAHTGLGQALFEQKRYDEAKSEFENARNLNDHDAAIYNWLGRVALVQQQYEEAERNFAEALKLAPAETPYRYNHGVALLGQKKLGDAEAEFRAVLSSSPTYELAYIGLGRVLLDQKRYAEAKDAFDSALKLDDKDPLIHDWLGRLAYALGRFDEAQRQFAQATELAPPGETSYRYNRGLTLLVLKRSGDAADAEAEFRKVIQAKPDYEAAHAGLGQALFEQRKLDDAKKEFELARTLKEKDPARLLTEDDAATYNWLGRIALLQQQYEEAERNFAKAASLAPAEVAYHYNRGLALSSLKRFAEAGTQFLAAISSSKDDNAAAYVGLGQALLDQERYDEAKSAFEHALSIKGPKANEAEIHSALGRVAFALGQYADSEQAFRRAVELNGVNAVYHYNLGLALERMLRYDEALREYQAGVEQTEKETDGEQPALRYRSYAYQSKANLLQKQGKYGPARAVWSKACEEYWLAADRAARARDADFFGNFGNVLYEIFDNMQMAEQMFATGLSYDPNHIAILAGQVGLYLDMRERHEFDRRDAHWKALDAYKRLVPLLEQKLMRDSRPATVVQLAKLFLQMEDCSEARRWLTSALPRNDAASVGDVDLVDVHGTLGVVCMKQREYAEAVERFEQARRLNPNNLTIRSNLAGAYAKAKRLEKAESEYRSLLAIAPTNLESLVGLGEVYAAMGDAGDVQRYETAIEYFARAVMITAWEDRSKTLKRNEEAALHYSLGYARVRLYETDPKTGPSILSEARRNFERCSEIDRSYEKANRARKKLDDWLRGSSPERVARYGPTCIFVLSLAIFIASQFWFYSGLRLNQYLGYYITITFGSLLFMIAGLYLPQILKLRVGGIELEKTSADQITAPRSFGITNSPEDAPSVAGPQLQVS